MFLEQFSDYQFSAILFPPGVHLSWRLSSVLTPKVDIAKRKEFFELLQSLGRFQLAMPFPAPNGFLLAKVFYKLF